MHRVVFAKAAQYWKKLILFFCYILYIAIRKITYNFNRYMQHVNHEQIYT